VSIAVDRDQAFLDGIRSIAEDVAAPHAEVVERDARFPRQTLDALREQRALSSARTFVRAAAKQKPGQTPPAAKRLSHVMSDLSLLRAEVSSALSEFTQASEEPGRERLSTMAAALRFNNLKIAASEQAPRICRGRWVSAGSWASRTTRRSAWNATFATPCQPV
jgi:hypothetical protein